MKATAPNYSTHPGIVLTIVMIVGLGLSFSTTATAQQAFPDWTFEQIGDLPMPEYAAGFVLTENPDSSQVLLFGGAAAYPWLTAIRVFTIPTESWNVQDETLPYPYIANERHGAALASNGKYYVGPGNGPGGWGQNDQIIEVDLDAGTVTERAPVVNWGYRIWGIALVAAPPAKGGVYLFGGWTGGGNSGIRHYDPTTDQTTLIGHLAYPRTVGAAIAHPNGNAYLFGGNRGPTVIEAFDLHAETIRTIPNPGGFAFNHSTSGWVADDGMIYLWNPNATFLGPSADSIIRFDPQTETMINLGDTPWPDGFPVSASKDPNSDAVYFFGFIAPGGVYGVSGKLLGGVWKLSPANQPPVADAGPDQTLPANDECEALAVLDGSGSFDPDSDPLTYEWASGLGSAFGEVVDYSVPLGSFDFTLTVDDGNGGSDTDTTTVTVIDTTGPAINALAASPNALWPPNHKMRAVEISVDAADNCDPDPTWCRITEVSSDEPILGGGTGKHAPDWEITGDLTVDLRAERAGGGDGRVYTITVTCSDDASNNSTSFVEVRVPHDKDD